MSEPHLEVQNISVSAGGKILLERVSLEVSRTQCLSIFGPSGSGKSTLLHAVAGLLPSSFKMDGEIRFDGARIDGMSATERSRKGMAILMQSLGLFFHMRVESNVMYPLIIRGVGRSEARERAYQLLRKVGLGELMSRRLGTLSGGQLQRVALARAMVYGPQLLLLDEPFKGLEWKLRERLLADIRELVEAGITLVFVSHEWREIEQLRGRVLFLDSAQIRKEVELA